MGSSEAVPRPLGRGAQKVLRKKRRELLSARISKGLLVALLAVVICIACYHSWRFIRLSYDFAVIEGRVISFEKGGKKIRGGEIEYEYYIAGKRMTETQGVSIKKNYGYMLEGKIFPVVCEREDPSNSEMLVTPNQYRFYAVRIPDSMKWVKKIWIK